MKASGAEHSRRRVPRWTLALITSLLSFAVLILVSVATDRAFGLLRSDADLNPEHNSGPTRRFEYHTFEFSFEAQLNQMGFRDSEYRADKKANTRIVAIGDSFTFGWGVQEREAWPKVLASLLVSAGMDVEVVNLGMPGTGVVEYAQRARRFTPVLKPDLIIVAVLQGNDLASLRRGVTWQYVRETGDIGVLSKLLRKNLRWYSDKLLRNIYPNLYDALTENANSSDGQAQSAKAVWKAQAQVFLKRLTPTQLGRYQRIDQRVRQRFVAGDLSPTTVSIAITRPDYYADTMALGGEITQELMSSMAEHLSELWRVAQKNDVRVLVVAVPDKVYASERDRGEVGRFGYATSADMSTSSAPDEAIRQASERAGLPFVSVTEAFRAGARESRFFFEYDGHFNADGHKRFAELLRPIVEAELNTSK